MVSHPAAAATNAATVATTMTMVISYYYNVVVRLLLLLQTLLVLNCQTAGTLQKYCNRKTLNPGHMDTVHQGLTVYTLSLPIGELEMLCTTCTTPQPNDLWV